MDKLLFRPTEVAEMFGCSRSVVYELLASGRLESVKINSSRRIPREAVDAFVESLRADVDAVTTSKAEQVAVDVGR